MPHINTNPGEHDFTVSAYIVKSSEGKNEIVLHRHKILQKLFQFGGHVELNEDLWEALEHEVREESGYEFSQLQVLQPKSRIKSIKDVRVHPVPACVITHPFPGMDHYHIDVAFILITSEKPNLSLGQNESQEVRYLDIQELNALTQKDIETDVREICHFALTEALSSWDRVEATNF